jgi:predicted alpha-1,2-mannosidase
MKTALFLLAFFFAAFYAESGQEIRGAASVGLTRYVRPEMGTVNSYELSHGNVYPAIGRPWGMHSFSPQTRQNVTGGWFYDYNDTEFRGIRLTHQLSPWIGDYACWGIFPVIGDDVPKSRAERYYPYDHRDETMLPELYDVKLHEVGIEMQVAPAMRSCVVEIGYPKGSRMGLVVDPFPGGDVRYDAGARVVVGKSVVDVYAPHEGVAPCNFFVLAFDQEVAGTTKTADGVLHVFFKMPSLRNKVTVWLSSSYISVPQAKRNLDEILGKDVPMVVREGRDAWNDLLSRVCLGKASDERKELFYTCLYRMLLFPKTHWEIDDKGKVVHFSPADGATRDGYWYAGTCFWDTFRGLFPFLNIVYPEQSAKMMQWMQNCWRECGWLPELSSPGLTDCMIGNNAVSVIADAWLSGVRGEFDIGELYDASVHEVENSHPKLLAIGRAGVSEYNSKGYVPRSVTKESASRTLEYAYADWCLARLGESLGRPQTEIDRYDGRSRNWRNVFDPERKIVAGRNSDGTFDVSFNPYAWGGDFTEGCAHHWTWSVLHDVHGLMEAMGGKREFERRLDEMFTMPTTADWSHYGVCIHEIREMQSIGFGQYAHGNQPVQHMIYLYNWTDSPWKAGMWSRRVMDRLYKPVPDGYCGDEDNGQTSAWYVWSALGMYPVCPVSGTYALGAPLFDRARLTLGNGRKLFIAGTGFSASAGKRGIVRLNGIPLEGGIVHRAGLLEGGSLEFCGEESEK